MDGTCSGGATCRSGACFVDECLFGCTDAFECDIELGVPAALSCLYFPGGVQGCAQLMHRDGNPTCGAGGSCPSGFNCRGIQRLPSCATDADCHAGEQCIGINGARPQDRACVMDVQRPDYASACGAGGACATGYGCQPLRVST